MFSRRILRVPAPKDLWDSSSSSSSEDNKEQTMKQKRQQIDIEMIDLTDSSEPFTPRTTDTTARTTVASRSTKEDYPTYVPSTLRPNSARYSILPAFPTSIYDEHSPPLLLASVPLKNLDERQRARRQPGCYPLLYSVDKNKCDIPSYFRDYYQSFMNSLIQQYQVDESILDYNLYRFSQCFQLFADDLIRQHHQATDYFLLDNQQKQYAFEFYLQIDVDLFFMKTCSFRAAQPRSLNEGLFCGHEPRSPFGFSPCDDCSLCKPLYNLTCRERLGPMIRFGHTRPFTFRNGYRTLLNCPADCQTRNLIYAMTCPCRKCEYIGETSQRLIDRLRCKCLDFLFRPTDRGQVDFEDHRQHFNRIFHEFLLGERNIQLNGGAEKDQQELVKDRMLLYRHAARCPSAMQLFLNFNPIYWCFAPLTKTEAEVQNQTESKLPSSLVLLDPVYPTSIASKDRSAILATPTTRSDENVRTYMRNLPPAPLGYDFSIQQRAQQFQYFKYKHDLTHRQNPVIDLFNVAVIAILPEDVSETVRRFVEALFITHAETELNISGRLVPVPSNDDEERAKCSYAFAISAVAPVSLSAEIQLLDRGEWCLDLIFPHHRAYMALDEA